MFAPSDGPTEAEVTSAWEAADLAADEAVGSLRSGQKSDLGASAVIVYSVPTHQAV